LICCEGGRVVEDNINNNHRPWGEEGDLAVHASVYGKVQAESNVNPNDQERRKGRERCLCFLLARAGLPSYLCRPCTVCVSLPRLGGDIYPTTMSRLKVPGSYFVTPGCFFTDMFPVTHFNECCGWHSSRSSSCQSSRKKS
jgi:hypothetical protein